MPRVQWPLWQFRPCIQVVFTRTATGGRFQSRTLLADSGAGARYARFELLLNEMDCLRCGVRTNSSIFLGGAYRGRFRIYDIAVQIPALGFAHTVRAVAVPSVPAGFDGIAGFRFLNRFTYGNFGDPGQFGLEC